MREGNRRLKSEYVFMRRRNPEVLAIGFAVGRDWGFPREGRVGKGRERERKVVSWNSEMPLCFRGLSVFACQCQCRTGRDGIAGHNQATLFEIWQPPESKSQAY